MGWSLGYDSQWEREVRWTIKRLVEFVDCIAYRAAGAAGMQCVVCERTGGAHEDWCGVPQVVEEGRAALRSPVSTPEREQLHAAAATMDAVADGIDAHARAHDCAGWDCATCGANQWSGQLREEAGAILAYLNGDGTAAPEPPTALPLPAGEGGQDAQQGETPARTLVEAVTLALWRTHADAVEFNSGKVLPPFHDLTDSVQQTWRRTAAAALRSVHQGEPVAWRIVEVPLSPTGDTSFAAAQRMRERQYGHRTAEGYRFWTTDSAKDAAFYRDLTPEAQAAHFGLTRPDATYRVVPLYTDPAPPAAPHGERERALEAEIASLNAWVNDLQSGMYINCVYCGHCYGPDGDPQTTMQQALTEHIRTCRKHPLAKALGDLDGIRRAVAEIIGCDPETWPDHGNAPLAITAALALREGRLRDAASEHDRQRGWIAYIRACSLAYHSDEEHHAHVHALMVELPHLCAEALDGKPVPERSSFEFCDAYHMGLCDGDQVEGEGPCPCAGEARALRAAAPAPVQQQGEEVEG